MPEMILLCTKEQPELSETALLLLDVDLLQRLGLICCRSLDGRSLDDDGLVCSSDHLTPDKRELLLVEKNWYLLDLAVWPNDLLDNLDPAWRRLAGLVHLLRLELDHLRGGLRLLGVHCDGLDAALYDLLLLLGLRLDLLLGSRTAGGLGSSRVILGDKQD